MSAAYRIAFCRVVTGLSMGLLAALPGCSGANATPDDEGKPPVFTVRLDDSLNGAALSRAAGPAGQSDRPRRALAFEMVGRAAGTGEADSTEQRAAAAQAAILDAFGKALIEARGERNQSTSDFTARLGPRLTVSHRTIGDGYELEVRVISGGAESQFIVRDGRLQHEPRDLALIRRIFEETNGEFSLLGAEETPSGAVARVACYVPAGFDAAPPVHVAEADDGTTP